MRAGAIESWFGVRAAGSTVTRECLGGLTTFLTMSYIMVVNPVILAAAGMPSGGAFLGTVLASAFATLLMGLVANLPVALAPGMGLNAFFAFTICVEMGVPWQTGLGIIVLVSMVFFLLTIGQVRRMLTSAVPQSAIESPERPLQIPPEVRRILQAHRQAQEARRDPGLRELLRTQRPVGHGGRMLDDGLRASEADRELDELQ